MKFDHNYARETLVRLIRTNSINPMLAPGAPALIPASNGWTWNRW
ncbi:MAG: hypothetical protein ABSG79_06625 [Bryobacteraceae bacterium]|jgi:hypothetical protein